MNHLKKCKSKCRMGKKTKQNNRRKIKNNPKKKKKKERIRSSGRREVFRTSNMWRETKPLRTKFGNVYYADIQLWLNSKRA